VTQPFANPQQVLKVVQGQRAALDEQYGRLSQVEQYHQTERRKVEGERDQAANDLGRAVLPALDAQSIARAAQITGLVGLPGEDLPGQREARRAFLVGRLRAISADPLYRDRELFRHPRTGSHVVAIKEAEEQKAPFVQVLFECESHERFARLIETGYGTAEQKTAWWRFSYWSDRSAAAELVAKLAKTSFAEVREEYRVAKETVATYDAELGRLRREVAAGEALDKEYAALYEEHQHLDEWALQHARVRLVKHMITADASLMGQRLASNKDLRLLFLTTSGLAAKLTYLDSIHGKHANEMRDDLNQQKTKLDTIYERAAYKGRGMPYDKLQALAVDRRPKYEKRFQRWGKTYQTVYVYDRWNRGYYYSDLLWWDLMTRGRYDGSYIHEVHSFHQSHPDYVYDPMPQHHAPTEAAHGDDDGQGRDDSDAAAASADADDTRDGSDAGDNDRSDLSTDAS